MSYVLMMYLAIMAVKVDTFTTEADCLKAAIKVNAYMIESNISGKAWCVKDDNITT